MLPKPLFVKVCTKVPIFYRILFMVLLQKEVYASISVLLVPRIKNHLSSFELGFLNNFSRQNLLRNLSLALFLLQRCKYGAKKCPKNHVRVDFSESENRKDNRKNFEGASVEPTIYLLLWFCQLTRHEIRTTKYKI